MGELFERLMCRLGRCWNCRPYSTDEGVGGKCIRCGKIHGWLTREDLRRYADKHAWL
jgi:hypothetical protein